jgi:hypothetical protein
MLKYNMVTQIGLERFEVDQQHQVLFKQYKSRFKQVLTLFM